jgi:hypothetical protein
VGHSLVDITSPSGRKGERHRQRRGLDRRGDGDRARQPHAIAFMDYLKNSRHLPRNLVQNEKRIQALETSDIISLRDDAS